MEEIDKIQTAIWECIDFLTSEKNEVIFMDSDGPRPEKLYTTIKIDPYDLAQNDEYINQSDGNIEQRTRVSFICSIQMYRNGSLSSAFELNKKLRQKSVLDHCAIYFNNQGIDMVVREVSPVRDVTQIVETNNEQRTQMDVVFNYTSVTIDKGIDGKGLGAEWPLVIEGCYKRSEADENPLKKTTVIEK